MKIFNFIIGIFAIFAAILMLCWPGASFISIGWLIAFFIGIWGICQIITYATNKKKGKTNKNDAANGTFGLVMGIAVVALSILSWFIPAIDAIFFILLLGIFALYLLISGVGNIAMAVALKKIDGHRPWVLSLIVGILEIILALSCIGNIFVNIVVFNTMLSVTIGAFGVLLIMSAFVVTDDDLDNI